MKGLLSATLCLGLLARAPAAAIELNVMPPTTKASPQWQAKMKELYETLSELLVDVNSDARFNSPKNAVRIKRSAKRLVELAHDLGEAKKALAPDADPTLKLTAGLFQDQTRRAYLALASGQRVYARSLLGGVTSYCIACHTRNGSGPQFKDLPDKAPIRDLYALDRGKLFAATRQYDRALSEFYKVIDESTSRSPLHSEQAARYALAIAVRVKQDPSAALGIADRVLAQKDAPFFLKQDASQWKESIQRWQAELPRRIVTEEGLYAEATRLMSSAREQQKYPADRSAEVTYLRASAVVHDLLQIAPNGAHAEEALLLAGTCYEVLGGLDVDDLHELYYEACVRRAPHTAIAEACFQRYQASTYFGFTGSSGTHLPGEVKDKLSQLEALALPATQVPN